MWEIQGHKIEQRIQNLPSVPPHASGKDVIQNQPLVYLQLSLFDGSMDLFLETWGVEGLYISDPWSLSILHDMSWNSVTIEMYLSQLMRLCPESVILF